MDVVKTKLTVIDGLELFVRQQALLVVKRLSNVAFATQ